MVQIHNADQSGTWTSKGTIVTDPSVFVEALGMEKKKEKQEENVGALLRITAHCLIQNRTRKPSSMLSYPLSSP